MSQKHWDEVYSKKSEKEVSWYQPILRQSLSWIDLLPLDPSGPVIDIGGGASTLVDALLDRGFSNLAVLDLSAKALDVAKDRLGAKAQFVDWIVSDVTQFRPEKAYQLWHDRAAFHFLTEENQVQSYLNVLNNSVAPKGYFILSTFSKTGPHKCSGLPIVQYSSEDLLKLFSGTFELLKTAEESHQTPSGSIQNFVYTLFQKR